MLFRSFTLLAAVCAIAEVELRTVDTNYIHEVLDRVAKVLDGPELKVDSYDENDPDAKERSEIIDASISDIHEALDEIKKGLPKNKSSVLGEEPLKPSADLRNPTIIINVSHRGDKSAF